MRRHDGLTGDQAAAIASALNPDLADAEAILNRTPVGATTTTTTTTTAVEAAGGNGGGDDVGATNAVVDDDVERGDDSNNDEQAPLLGGGAAAGGGAAVAVAPDRYNQPYRGVDKGLAIGSGVSLGFIPTILGTSNQPWWAFDIVFRGGMYLIAQALKSGGKDPAHADQYSAYAYTAGFVIAGAVWTARISLIGYFSYMSYQHLGPWLKSFVATPQANSKHFQPWSKKSPLKMLPLASAIAPSTNFVAMTVLGYQQVVKDFTELGFHAAAHVLKNAVLQWVASISVFIGNMGFYFGIMSTVLFHGVGAILRGISRTLEVLGNMLTRAGQGLHNLGYHIDVNPQTVPVTANIGTKDDIKQVLYFLNSALVACGTWNFGGITADFMSWAAQPEQTGWSWLTNAGFNSTLEVFMFFGVISMFFMLSYNHAESVFGSARRRTGYDGQPMAPNRGFSCSDWKNHIGFLLIAALSATPNIGSTWYELSKDDSATPAFKIFTMITSAYGPFILDWAGTAFFWSLVGGPVKSGLSFVGRKVRDAVAPCSPCCRPAYQSV